MHGLEDFTHVLWSPSWLGVDLESVAVGGFVKERLCIGGG
jgi:hypothetical protein